MSRGRGGNSCSGGGACCRVGRAAGAAAAGVVLRPIWCLLQRVGCWKPCALGTGGAEWVSE